MRTPSLSRHEENNLEKELWADPDHSESAYGSNSGIARAHRFFERCSRFFEDLETASRTEPFHAPSQPLVFQCFFFLTSLAATLVRLLIHGICAVCQETFCVDPTIPDEAAAILLTDVCAGSPNATTGLPVDLSMGRPVARTDEPKRETQSETIFHPKFVRTLPTVELPSYKVEAYPQSFKVEQPKNNISDLKFEKFSTPSTFLHWKTSSKAEVFSSYNHSSEVVRWSKEAEMATSVGDLQTSRLIFGRPFPNKIIQNSNFRKKVHLEEQKAQMDDRFFRGRQIAFMICEYFRVTSTHEAILDFSDLSSVIFRGDDVQGFDTRWDEVLLSTHEVPSDNILVTVDEMRLRPETKEP